MASSPGIPLVVPDASVGAKWYLYDEDLVRQTGSGYWAGRQRAGTWLLCTNARTAA